MSGHLSFPSQLISATLFFQPEDQTKIVVVCPSTFEKDNFCRLLKSSAVAKKIFFEKNTDLSFAPKDRSLVLVSKKEKKAPIKEIASDLGLSVQLAEAVKFDSTESPEVVFNRLFGKDASQGISYLNSRLEENPLDLFALRQLYVIYKIGAKEIKEDTRLSRIYLERIYNMDPNNRAIFEEFVRLCLPVEYSIKRETPDFPKARDLLEKALEKDPGDQFSLAPLFHIYTRLAIEGVEKDVPRALRYVEAALEQDPTHPFALSKIYDAHVNTRYDEIPYDPEKVLRYYHRAFEIEPNTRALFRVIVEIQMKRKEVLPLIEFLEKILQKYPSHEFALEHLVNIYMYGKFEFKSDRDKAVICLERFLEHNPNCVFALKHLLKLFLLNSKKDEARAIGYLEKALAKDPTDKFAFSVSVCLYLSIGEKEKALTCIEKFYRDNPNNGLANRFFQDRVVTKDFPAFLDYFSALSRKYGSFDSVSELFRK